MNISGSGLVSIQASIVISLLIKVLKKYYFLFPSLKKWYARSCLVFHQKICCFGSFNSAQSKKSYAIQTLWQYRKVNKQKTKTIKLARNFLKKVLNYKIFKSIFRDVINRKGLLLRSGDIEENPGPSDNPVLKDEKLVINSYNIRGLKEYAKLKRTLNNCAGKLKANNNVVFQFQETHLENEDKGKLNLMWRGNYILSPGGNKSRGCLTLFDPSWEIVEEKCDPGGRFVILTIRKHFGIFTFINLYAPNEQSIDFFESVFIHAIETKDKFSSELIITGDFNLIINPLVDSANRIQSNNERIVRDFVKDSFNAMGIRDCYRYLHNNGGYTWSRGTCLSRLDMAYASSSIIKNLALSTLNWAFEKSDHALLECVFVFKSVKTKGPGLPRLSPDILNIPEIVNDIKVKLREIILEMPESWNPHIKWEYLKVMLRSLAWEETGRQNKIKNFEEEALTSQINRLHDNKEFLINTGKLDSITEIDKALKDLENSLHEIWVEKSKKLAFLAGVKWFDEGEKSNKYFLNIIKKRRSETYLDYLENGEKKATGQAELNDLITEFYTELYDARTDLDDNYDNFFPPDLPKLDNEDRVKLDENFTSAELEQTLKACNESAPGPDGITYKYYEVFWDVLGKFLLEAWEFSISIGQLPLSQRQSTITLLPKEGKDIKLIGNWRPITLTNCDLKVITKTIANRTSKILDKIISPTQTAYIPGRVVHDNLRMFDFYENYCRENNVDAILMSMDAKKAFDSVDHKYMFNTLRKFGFSEEFIETVRILYKDIEADILVNGYRTGLIKIRRCVKQGDAFSCALFIICIDPLIRNIERNKKIKAIELRTSLSNKIIKPKSGAFADDVGTITKGDKVTIDEVFKEYRRFSKISGIEINEAKTEIMRLGRLNAFLSEQIEINNGEKTFYVNTVESVKICGITFSSNAGLAYEKNVIEKINRLKKKLLSWQFRNLTMGGKILVTKTFGISQLIYSMQVCHFKEID